MTAYYNEHDAFAAAWLRGLIKRGLIAPGDVDERDIQDVLPSDLRGYTQCHFFAGIGAWSYSLRRAGWPDDRPVWTGSCPCQPFSAAGAQLGFADERHLWPHWHHLIWHERPTAIFGEQVTSPVGRAWFALVRSQLEATGYAVGAADLCAASINAPHKRPRIFWVADTHGGTAGRGRNCRSAQGPRLQCRHDDARRSSFSNPEWLDFTDGCRRPVEPGTFPMAHGITGRVGLLRGYGNAIVAPLAKEFIEAYLET